MKLLDLMARYGWQPTEQFDADTVLAVMKDIGRERVHEIAVMDANTPPGKLTDLALLEGADVLTHAACGWLLTRGNVYDAWYEVNPDHVHLTPDVVLGLHFAWMRGKAMALNV